MSDTHPTSKPSRTPRRCPICGRAADALFRPFCSRRCADVDLARWLDGAYRIPATDEEPDDDETPKPDRG